jgi:signal peptidase
MVTDARSNALPLLWAPPARAQARPRRRVVTALQAVVSAVAVSLALCAVLLLQGPRMVGWTGMVVLSGSMEPALPVGSLAMVAPVDPQDVKVGDIISYQHPTDRAKLVSHRVTAIEGPPLRFRTKGDANEAPDAISVPATRVRGKVRYVVPHLGDVSQFMRSGRGFLALLVVPGAALIALELHHIGRQVWRSRRQEGA